MSSYNLLQYNEMLDSILTSCSLVILWFLLVEEQPRWKRCVRRPSLQWTDRPRVRRQQQRVGDSGVALVTSET